MSPASSQPTLFTRIINREIPATFVHEDERCIAIRDINPQAPTHVLIIPRKPLVGVQEATDEDAALLGHLLLVGHQLAARLGVAAAGYRLVLNAGDDGGQTVPHLHVHLLGGRRMTWPPG
jgi:histidine triad (HIT) family protein